MPVTADRRSLASYARFPAELDRDWLGRVCHLSEADLAVIRRRTDPVTQLGYAAQLVTVRATGTFQSDPAMATAAGLSPSRVHQLVAAADPDALDAARGELRAAGWPAPEDPDSGDDTELDGRDTIAGRLSDEVSWLRQCADWLAHLDADSYPPAVSLRPAADWPDRAVVAVDLARVAAVIDRIAADVDELARARRVQDLTTAAVLADPRAKRRRRLASRTWSSGPSAPAGDCLFPRPCNWSGPGMPGRPSDTSAARLTSGPATPATRSGHANDHPVPQRTPGLFRKLDALVVLTGPSLPAPPGANAPRGLTSASSHIPGRGPRRACVSGACRCPLHHWERESCAPTAVILAICQGPGPTPRLARPQFRWQGETVARERKRQGGLSRWVNCSTAW